ncbi:vitamin K-dependent protein C-like [Hoplias malabaricus]|uniref:vitamin K-dependent protein C-like n=1 Tax=Hoplias malabaricus TaxID=27720 RepID=UPI003461FE93
MARTPFLFCLFLIFLCISMVLTMSVFYSSTKANMLLRTRRANSLLEELKPASMERECVEELCNFEEAREIFENREATLEFWEQYVESITFNCSMKNGDCDHNCHDRKAKDGRFCSCVEGYQLQQNKKCIPTDENSCGQILIAKSSHSTKPKEIIMPWLVGGEVGQKGESPWQALLLNARRTFHCGGVLIDENWVLTAAHCLQASIRFSVRLGEYLRFMKEDSEVTIRVSNIIPHPEYNSVTYDNDIGLLRLATPVKFTQYILPACLPSRRLAEHVLHLNGTEMVVTGWGKQNETDTQYSSELGYIKVPLVDREVCARHTVKNLTENMLCAGIIGDVKDACQGDSGGPMMTLYHNTWFLTGIVSWGEGCGRTDKLGIYTKVSNYLEWIDNTRKEVTGP